MLAWGPMLAVFLKRKQTQSLSGRYQPVDASEGVVTPFTKEQHQLRSEPRLRQQKGETHGLPPRQTHGALMTCNLRFVVFFLGFKSTVWRNVIRKGKSRVLMCIRSCREGTSLMAQWLRIRLPMQGTRV